MRNIQGRLAKMSYLISSADESNECYSTCYNESLDEYEKGGYHITTYWASYKIGVIKQINNFITNDL